MKDNRFKSPPDYAISGEITDKDDKSSNKEDCLAEASELPKLNQYVYYLDVLGFNTWDLKQINELRVSSRSSPSLLPKVAKLLGCIIQNSPTLKKLDIRDFNMNREDILEIFNRDGIYICALEEIIFPTHSHDLGIYDFQLMLSFVKSIKSVKTLILRDCGLDDTIIGSLIVTLENTQISELDVQGNQFSHNGLTALLISKDLNSLKSLKISCKSKEDIELVSRYLCREGLKLECIELQFSTECSKCTNPTRIVESIPNSSQLKRLDMFGLDSCFASHNKKHVSLFQTKVCNLSTFQDLCRSNHQLQRIQCFDLEAAIYRSDNLAKALMINMERMSLSDKIRCKLFTFYFDGDFSVLPFLEMELKTIPYILTILGNPMKKCEFVSYDPYDSRPAIAVSADHLETMYQFIRKWNLPTLFEH
ncbi:hypothetical protein ACHAXS_006609 [Conticribra weissflogii]